LLININASRMLLLGAINTLVQFFLIIASLMHQCLTDKTLIAFF